MPPRTAPDTVPVDSLNLLSPITTPCRVVAQATNYASHVKDVGRDPAKTPLTFFRKASGSVTGPFGDIVKPEHVKLLDYELEVGLVFGRELPVGTEVTDANLADFVAGLVVTNDISARDVQLPEIRSLSSRSPIPPSRRSGPPWCWSPPRNSSVSVSCGCGCRSTAKCARTCWSMATSSSRRCRRCRRCGRFQKLDAGDILLTGTPVGTALTLHGVTPKGDIDLGAFLTAQFEKNPAYLQDGDVVEATVATDDGAIDLGVQRQCGGVQNDRTEEQARAEFVPVVIIGAGPAGIAAATLLGQYGIETLVLDRHRSRLPAAAGGARRRRGGLTSSPGWASATTSAKAGRRWVFG